MITKSSGIQPQMNETLRCEMMDSNMEYVYSVLYAAYEAGDEIAYRAIFEEWQEYLIGDESQPNEVTWIDVMIPSV